MIEILKDKYWSKSEAFLLPLTGLSRTHKYQFKTYLFWNDFSIEDYYLILKFTWDNYEEFMYYCRRVIFPILDKKGYLHGSYDFDKETVFVLDISEWAWDVEMFLKGKYSKMGKEAKAAITEYHTFFDKIPKILIEISASLEPTTQYDLLGGVTPIEYVAENYGLNLEALKQVGEIGGIYHKDQETLTIDDKKKEKVED